MRRNRNRRSPRLCFESLESRDLLTTLVALIDDGVDLSNMSHLPYIDFTYAYNSGQRQSAASNHSLVDSGGPFHGEGVLIQMLRAIGDTKSQPGAAAADVKIMPIKYTPSNFGSSATSIIHGVYWAADHGAAVINLSFEFLADPQYFNTSNLNDPLNYTYLSQAIQYASSKGAVVVGAAGNHNWDIDNPSNPHPIYPAYTHSSNMLVAAAVESSGDLSSVSSWGPTHVDLGAYTGGDGLTSFAAGYTSGVTGVIAALTPGWSAVQRVDHIKQTVVPHTQPNVVGSWSTTNGNISPANAVSELGLSGSHKFDFGTATSPLAAGYTRVTDLTAYSSSPGYGWITGILNSADRATGSDLNRDFVYTPDATFGVDLANGTYDVTVTMGDLGTYAHDLQEVHLEGALVGTVTTSAGQVVTNTYRVTVLDGQLTLRLKDGNGSDVNAVIEGLEIISV